MSDPKLPWKVRRLGKKTNHFNLRRPLDYGHNMKGRETKLLVSCNLIDGNQRPLDLGHSVKGREAELLVSCNLIGENRRPLDLQP